MSDDDLPSFEALDGKPGPARPLSPGEASARADALLARLHAPRPRARPLRVLVAAALLLACTGVLAAVLSATSRDSDADATRSAAPRSAREPLAPSSGQSARTESHQERAPDHAARSASPVVTERDVPEAPRARAPRETGDGQRAQPPGDLLQQANAARARRDFARAESLYLRVATLYAGSDDADAALLSAAELESQQLGRPGDAIALYRRLLSTGPHAALVEQALAGLARAYRALGQRPLEQSTWRRLLADHPNTWFAEEARTRLSAMEP